MTSIMARDVRGGGTSGVPALGRGEIILRINQELETLAEILLLNRQHSVLRKDGNM